MLTNIQFYDPALSPNNMAISARVSLCTDTG